MKRNKKTGIKKRAAVAELTSTEDPKMAMRAAVIDVRAADGDTPASVRMSVSSEEPVLTYTYFNNEYQRVWEILDHSDSSIDKSRMQDGLVIQDTHYGDQIGLMDVSIGDRKMGGPVVFCSGGRAKEIEQDALDMLRKNVSVGYMTDSESMKLEGEQDGIPVVRVMSWTPYEASFEPIPADTSVGVNRADKTIVAQNVPIEKKEERKMLTGKEMAALFARGAEHGIDAAGVQALISDDSTADSVRSALDAQIVEAQGVALTEQRSQIEVLETRESEVASLEVTKVVHIGGDVETENKLLRNYSVQNVLRDAMGMNVDIQFERDINDECRKLGMGSKRGGQFIIPHAVLAKRDFTVSGTSSSSVATNLYASEFIDLLRTYMVLGNAGVSYLTGLAGDIAIPKMSAGSTGYWVSESGTITESQPTLGQVTGTPHTCGVMTDISRRLILQSTPDAEFMVRDEIIQRIARTIQVGVFQGTGGDGQPSAITSASGINNPSVTQGTPTYAEMLGFPGAILADSAPADGQKWIGTAEVWAKMAATDKSTSTAQFVLNPDNNMMLGREFLVTEDVGANSLFFGAWSTVVIGVWGAGIDLNMDTATLSSSGGLRIVGLQDTDVMVRLGEALAYNATVTS